MEYLEIPILQIYFGGNINLCSTVSSDKEIADLSQRIQSAVTAECECTIKDIQLHSIKKMHFV